MKVTTAVGRSEQATVFFENAKWIRHYMFPSSDDVYMVWLAVVLMLVYKSNRLILAKISIVVAIHFIQHKTKTQEKQQEQQ